MSIPYSQKVNQQTATPVTSEPHIVGIVGTATYSPGFIRLVQVPQGPAPAVTIPGYTEITSGSPTGTQFLVNYTTGVITFNTSQDGTSVAASYNGLGSEFAAEDMNEVQEPLNTVAAQSITYNWPAAPTVVWSLATSIVKPNNISTTITDDFTFPHNVIVSGLTSTGVVHNNASGLLSTSFINLATEVTGTLPVSNGGTGDSTLTPYAVLAGGTTSTGPLQQVSGLGTSGFVLTSTGPASLPTWQATSAGTPASPNTSIQFNNSGVFGGSANLEWNGTSLLVGPDASINSSDGSVSFANTNFTVNAAGNTVINGFVNIPNNNPVTISAPLFSGAGTHTSNASLTITTATPASDTGSSATIVGGSLTLSTGSNVGAGTNLTGGNIMLTTGAASGGGAFIGGSIILTTGEHTGIGGSTQGGSITLTASKNSPFDDNDAGGNITLTSFTAANGGNLYLTGSNLGFGQIGVGTGAPNSSASVDITSTTRGFLPPRMTTTQRNAISSPAEGLIVYDTTLHQLWEYQNGAWAEVGATPAGSNTQIQYNNSGAFGASSNLTWDNSLTTLELQGTNPRLFLSGSGEPFITLFSTTGSHVANIEIASSSLIIETNNMSIGMNDLNDDGAPDASALLDLRSTTRGFLPPRMTSTQRTAISSPATGLIVYDTTSNQWMGWNGSSWVILG